MTLSFCSRTSVSKWMPQFFPFFLLGNNSKFPLDSTPIRNRGGGDGDFQFKPFFVSSPTAPEPSNSFFNFPSPSHELEQQQVSSRAFKVKRI